MLLDGILKGSKIKERTTMTPIKQRVRAHIMSRLPSKCLDAGVGEGDDSMFEDDMCRLFYGS